MKNLLLILIIFLLSCENKKKCKYYGIDIEVRLKGNSYEIVHLNWKEKNSKGQDSVFHGIPLENAVVTMTLVNNSDSSRIQINTPLEIK